MFDLGNYDRIASLTGETFRQASERTGVPIDLLLVIREAIGFAVAEPDDHMREDEAEVLPVVQASLAGGFPPSAIERMLRVYGESLRRIVETESEAWMNHVVRSSSSPIRPGTRLGLVIGPEAAPVACVG